MEGDFKPPSLQEHTAVPYKVIISINSLNPYCAKSWKKNSTMLKAMRCDVLLISLRCKRMSTWNSLFLLFSVVSLWCKGFHYSKYFHLTYLLNLFVCVCFFFFLNYYRVICTCSAANSQQRTRRHYGLLIFVSALCFLLRLFFTCVPFLFWFRLLFFFLGSRVWRKQAAKSWVRFGSIFSWVPKRPVNGRS